MSFKNVNRNEVVRIIRFKYNENDIENCIKKLSCFRTDVINTVPFNEEFNISKKDGICMVDAQRRAYMRCKQTLFSMSNISPICRSLKEKHLNIDNFGNVFPCFLYKAYLGTHFSFNDYNRISSGKYHFCEICDSTFLHWMNMYKIEQIT